MKKLFIIILIAVACSKEDDPAPVNNVPEALYARRITQFYAEASSRGVVLPTIKPKVIFVKKTEFEKCDLVYGLTKSFKNGNEYTIHFNEDMASLQNDGLLLMPVFREMAHLLLDKPYSENSHITYKTEVVRNIMYRCSHDRGFDVGDSELTSALNQLFGL